MPEYSHLKLDQGFGFTIEYHNYYKVVTNLQTSRSYCLIGWNQTIPEECNSLYSFQTPIQLFSVDTGYDTVMPFIEVRSILFTLYIYIYI